MLEYAMPFTPTYTGDIVALGEQKMDTIYYLHVRKWFFWIFVDKIWNCLPNEKQIKCDGKDEPVNSHFFKTY